jgi:HSP20 family protein
MKLIPYFNQAPASSDLLRAFWGVNEDGSVIAWAPRLDVHEGKDAYQVQVDLPGVDKKDVEVTLEEGVLTVRGTRQSSSEAKAEDGSWHRQERSYGSFQRSLSLGEGVDADGVKAELKDGVLSISVPKKEAAKARTIRIA